MAVISTSYAEAQISHIWFLFIYLRESMEVCTSRAEEELPSLLDALSFYGKWQPRGALLWRLPWCVSIQATNHLGHETKTNILWSVADSSGPDDTLFLDKKQ